MIIESILNNSDLRHHEFPVTDKLAFLAHAGVCPLPRVVGETMSQAALGGMENDQEKHLFPEIVKSCRVLGARLLHVEAEEIALVGPTSLGLSFIAGGLEWSKGDRILVYFDDYPSNVYPWTVLREKGVEVSFLKVPSLGRIECDQVLSQVDDRTRLVALASCHFLSGYRPDIKAIGQGLHQRNILFSVDGIQTLGAFPMDMEHVDFLAADAHKWMLGPCGAGLLYVSKRCQNQLRPIVYGWNNVRCPDFVAQEEIEFKSGAHRYEAGSYSFVSLAGLKACLELMLDVGEEAISRELFRKRQWLSRALLDKGYDVLEPDLALNRAGGMLSFTSKTIDLKKKHVEMEERGIVISLRSDRQQRNYLRISPHFYNSDEEIERCLAML